MKNLEWCIYTYRHRRAFEYCVKKLILEPSLRAEMLERAKIHDMDKMLMYLSMDQKEAQKIHTMTQPHHLENDLDRSYEDLVEAVIDYECAPYTKLDKPLNAYDFVNLLVEWKVLDKKTSESLFSIMEKLGIACSDTYTRDIEGQEYIKRFSDITEDMINEEIRRYTDSITNK